MARDSKPQPAVPRLGIALGGGAALGWAHIGVLRVLEEAGVPVAAVAGTSIGALVGACWIAGMLDPLEDIARAMNWRRMLGLADPQMGAPGLFKGAALIGELERYIGGRRIEDLAKPFVAVASDLIAGEEVRISSGPVSDAVRASISIPGIFVPVTRGGALLVDGGLVNPVPVAAVRELGVDVVLAIDVTGDYHGRARAAGIGAPATEKGRAKARNDWMATITGHLFTRTERAPGLYSVAATSAALIMRELAHAKLAIEPPDVHVIPKVGHFSVVEFDRADDLIAAGRAAMQAQIGALQEVLTRSPK
jgi:NTE family protein